MTRGRLVKKSEQEKLSSMQVENYPWKDFSSDTVLLPDNPRRSVVLAKTHPQQELKQKVQNPPEFSRTFGNPGKPLFPEDMTAEFLASQEELRQRKRRMQMDEDEAVALELLDLTDIQQQDVKTETPAPAQGMTPSEANADAAASVSKPGARSTAAADISDLSKLAAQKNLGLADGDLDFAGSAQSARDIDAELRQAFEDGREQGRAEGAKSGYEAARAEFETLSHPEAANADTPAATFDEGFAQGVSRGREEALSEAEEKYKHSMALFTRALGELQHLKGELLSTGREIFAEIAQICAERVLRQSVRLNDESLRSIFEAATAQFQRQDAMKIEMHPEDIARIEPLLSSEQQQSVRLVANATLQRGDLKLEANNEVVSLDLHNTVQQVIDSLKDDLFETNKKDDSTEKAG